MEHPCSAHSSRTGLPCRKSAIKGGSVCATHGGSIGHVKAKAEQRIASFVDPALSELIRIVRNGDSDTVKLAAVKDVLDRAGFRPVDRVQHEGEMLVRQYVGVAVDQV